MNGLVGFGGDGAIHCLLVGATAIVLTGITLIIASIGGTLVPTMISVKMLLARFQLNCHRFAINNNLAHRHGRLYTGGIHKFNERRRL